MAKIIFSMINIIVGSWILSHTAMAATIQDLVILDQLLRNDYDRRATPTNHFNKTSPTNVYLELFIRLFGSPNPLTMDYKVDLYLKQKWKDERLKHKDLQKPMDLNDPNLVKGIWKPEVYFPNAKDADFQRVTVPNVLVRINPDGEILYMLRLKMTFSCMMDLSKFPLDRQTCTIEVASFSKTVEELILHWKHENPITMRSLEMSQFEMVDIVPSSHCPGSLQNENYSCLVAEFHLYRLLGFHLVQSYLPTILMVVISWVSFWMDVNSVPGRVTLGITTLLTVSSKATKNIESSYIKAIDVWMGTCTAFVFLALLEFTIVNYLWRKESDGKMKSISPNQFAVNLGISETRTTTTSTTHTRSRTHNNKISMIDLPMIPIEGINMLEPLKAMKFNKYKNAARYIDETCRYAFPLAFTIFLISYWSYYLIV